MSESQFSIADSFDIDGQLADIDPERAFVLGVEWALVRAGAQRGEEFHAFPVHSDNRRRLTALLSKYGYESHWDAGDDWSYVTAQPTP